MKGRLTNMSSITSARPDFKTRIQHWPDANSTTTLTLLSEILQKSNNTQKLPSSHSDICPTLALNLNRYYYRFVSTYMPDLHIHANCEHNSYSLLSHASFRMCQGSRPIMKRSYEGVIAGHLRTISKTLKGQLNSFCISHMCLRF